MQDVFKSLWNLRSSPAMPLMNNTSLSNDVFFFNFYPPPPPPSLLVFSSSILTSAVLIKWLFSPLLPPLQSALITWWVRGGGTTIWLQCSNRRETIHNKPPSVVNLPISLTYLEVMEVIFCIYVFMFVWLRPFCFQWVLALGTQRKLCLPYLFISLWVLSR